MADQEQQLFFGENRSLFSDYYLKERLNGLAEWKQDITELYENSGNFPGGKTRSTFEKLMKSKVPVFDGRANIEPLIELCEELAEVEAKIKKTDWLSTRWYIGCMG